MRFLRFKNVMRERVELSETGEETLLSVSEYYGVKPRAEAFKDEEHETRAESLEGYRRVWRGDFVMNYMLAWKGAYGVSEYDGIVSPAYAVFQIDKRKIDLGYLHHRTRSDPMRALFRSRSKGIIDSRLRLYPDALLATEIDLPDLATQQAIADFLDRETARIDQLIEKREAFLSLIDEKKTSLAVKAVDGSILKGVAKGIEGWFGALPESWQARRAKFLFRERQDRSDSGEEELLTVSHITGVTRRSDKDVNMFLAESTEGYKLVSEGDVVINTMWAWMGAMGVSPVEGLISPSYGVYAPRPDAFEADYLDLLLRSRPFVAEATRRSKGIHSSRLRLYPDAFLDILLPVPSREAQRGILTALRVATEREEQLATLSCLSLGRLREFRAALITAAVTGQIDVARWGKRGTSDRRLDAIETDMVAAAQPERQQARA